MPKKKKTRKQKILADKRHKIAKLYSAEVVTKQIERVNIEYKPQLQADQNQQPLSTTIDASRYQYLHADLFKTMVLTFSIIAGELILRYVFF